MKFVFISDTHCRHHFVKLPKGDVLIHAGDISHKGSREEVIDFLQWFSKQEFQYKIFIAGNHDFFFEKASEEDDDKIFKKKIFTDYTWRNAARKTYEAYQKIIKK